MRLICGVDGCRRGWVVIYKDIDSGQIAWRLCKTANELIYQEPKPLVIAIDIPIGLTEMGSRTCDLEARRLLGWGRASSVFPAPIRPILAAGSYREACQIRFHIERKNISMQTWLITPKINEVDAILRQNPALQASIHEVHPEVCFYFLAGQRYMQYNKKSKKGQQERCALLEPIYGHWLQTALAERRQLASEVDDVCDAFMALWTAERIYNRSAQTIPAEPLKDAFGLRMEITA